MTTCPNCGHTFHTDREKAEAARKAALEATRPPRNSDERRAYVRDYQRGQRHARKGAEPEPDASDAYLAGFARGANE